MANQKENKKKKKKSIIEAELFSFLQKNMKIALDMALDEILKDFK